MHRLAIFFLSVCLVVTSYTNALQMFSLEGGSVYSETYSLSHICAAGSKTSCSVCINLHDSLTPQHNNHSHVILLSSIAKDEIDIISRLSKLFPRKLASYPLNYLNLPIQEKLLSRRCKSNPLSLQISAILQSAILLI